MELGKVYDEVKKKKSKVELGKINIEKPIDKIPLSEINKDKSKKD